MKRLLSILLVIFVLIMALAACGGKDKNAEVTPTPSPDSSSPDIISPIKPGQPSMLASQLREQFADTERYNYTEPLYNLPRNFQFILKGSFFMEDDWEHNNDIDDVVQIYASSNFIWTSAVIFDHDRDDETGEMVLSPWAPAFDLQEAAASGFTFRMSGENDWGNASKYYLVRYVDFETGAALDKPLVTLFTIKAELDAPQVKYRVDENGRGIFYWDAVPGATSYIVGKLSVENGNAASDSFKQVDSVTGTAWHKFGDAVTWNRDRLSFFDDEPEWYKDSARLQNEEMYNFGSYVHEDEGFCVFAVKDGGNSNMSNIVAFDEFAPMTPYRPDDSMDDNRSGDDGSLILKYGLDVIWVPDVESAPIYQSVEMMDGSYKNYLIEYPDSLSGVDTYTRKPFFGSEETYERIIAGTYGTLFKNGIIIEDMGGYSMSEALQYLKDREIEASRAAGGVAEFDANINDTPGVDIDFGNNGSDVVIDNEARPGPAHVPESDNIEIFNVYANSALSAYISICLLNRIEEISLYDFPEAADGALAVEAFFEAYFQNNGYIGGVEWPSIGYDYVTRTLYVDYVMTADEQKKLQQEVDAKADEIVGKIITPGMTDYQKEEAINNYLCAYAEYDWDALEAMMAMPAGQAIAPAYKYSQTAYGILVNNKGICQSYAEAFDILADKAGLQSIVVVGELNGLGGHAWNRVLLDGEWFTLDVTNNGYELFYNEYFNMPDEIAAMFVTEWGIHVLDAVLIQFSAYSYGYDYYSQNGMGIDVYGLEDFLVENLSRGGSFEVVVIDFLDVSPDAMTSAMQNAANRARVNFTPRISLWVLRIDCD